MRGRAPILAVLVVVGLGSIWGMFNSLQALRTIATDSQAYGSESPSPTPVSHFKDIEVLEAKSAANLASFRQVIDDVIETLDACRTRCWQPHCPYRLGEASVLREELPHSTLPVVKALSSLAATVPGSLEEHFALNNVEQALQPLLCRLRNLEQKALQELTVEDETEVDEALLEGSFGYLLPPNPKRSLSEITAEIERVSGIPLVRRLDGAVIVPLEAWQIFLDSCGWPSDTDTAQELYRMFIRYQKVLESCGVLTSQNI